MSYITPRQREMLEGLRHVNCAYVSANEHNAALDLCERGLARSWCSSIGAILWQITETGRESLNLTLEREKDKL